MLQRIRGHGGFTLVECLVSMFIIAFLVVAVLGAFYVSRIGTGRARHRTVAMNMIKSYIEREISAGYDGGNDGDYYDTTPEAGWPVTETIDDGLNYALTYTLTPEPTFPDNVYSSYSGPGTGVSRYYPTGQVIIKYKIVGFKVEWVEPQLGGAPLSCSERALVHVSQHKE